jgi:pilus assembly protein CpaF
MSDEVGSALMRPAPPNAALLASGPPTGTASIVSVPPVLGGLDLAEPEPLVERTQAQAQMPSGVARHAEAESRTAAPVRANGRSAAQVSTPPKPPERRSMPPVLSVRASSIPPAASADLRSLMALLARELDVDNTQPSAVEDEGRWRKAERVIETHIGELAKNGTLPPSIDKRALAAAALHEAVGLGPLDALLDDASVCEIIVERVDRIRVGRGEGLEHGEGEFSSVQALLTVMRRLCAQGGVSEPKTSCDLSLPSGLHVVAVFPSAATDGPVLSVRRRPPTPQSLEDLQEAGVLDDEASEAIASELEAGRNVLIVGEPGTALATFVGALIAGFDVDDRVALLERAPDVPLGGRSAIGLRRAEAELDELLSRVAYLGKARLVLHELRQAELGRALEALAERRDGALASTYAPTLDALLARLGTSADGDLERVTRALPFLVHLTLEGGKTRVARAGKLKAEGEKLSVGD